MICQNPRLAPNKRTHHELCGRVILKERVVQLERGIEEYTCLGGNVGSTLVKYSAVHCDLNTFEKPVANVGTFTDDSPKQLLDGMRNVYNRRIRGMKAFSSTWRHMSSCHFEGAPQRFKRIHPPNLPLLQTASMTRDLFLGSWHPFTRWGACHSCCIVHQWYQ